MLFSTSRACQLVCREEISVVCSCIPAGSIKAIAEGAEEQLDKRTKQAVAPLGGRKDRAPGNS